MKRTWHDVEDESAIDDDDESDDGELGPVCSPRTTLLCADIVYLVTARPRASLISRQLASTDSR